MIIGIGIDLVEVQRLASILDKWGERFTKRCFSTREDIYCGESRCPAIHYAGRFAVKEAFIKSIGGPQGIRYQDIEVVNLINGNPDLIISGETRKILDSFGVLKMHVSLSHTDHYATAMVILETKT
jgi:holo-[acyl-carrier protein] synthase